MKSSKEKFVELDGKIKLVNQKIDLIIKTFYIRGNGKISNSYKKRY